MSWKDTVAKLKTEAIVAGKKALENSKTYVAKTESFTYDKLKESKLLLKDAAEFDKIREDKARTIIFFLRKSPECENIVIQVPLILARSWIVSAQFKFVDLDTSPEIAGIRELQVTEAPTVIVWKNEEVVRKIVGQEKVAQFLKDFNCEKDA